MYTVQSRWTFKKSYYLKDDNKRSYFQIPVRVGTSVTEREKIMERVYVKVNPI